MQDGKVLSYASRALSHVESRYSQTEQEILATVWGVEHSHLCVYGAQFSIMRGALGGSEYRNIAIN